MKNEDYRMPLLKCDDYFDFMSRVEDVLETALEMDYASEVAIVAKFNDMKQIIRLFLSDLEISKIDIDDDYKDEYYCSIYKNADGKSLVWVEPFSDYPTYVADTVVFVFEDCNSNRLKRIDCDVIIEVDLPDEKAKDLDTREEESVYISRDKNNVPQGFSKSWSNTEGDRYHNCSFTYYSNSLEDLRIVAKGFDVRL